jgi:lipoate-protein ligase A
LAFRFIRVLFVSDCGSKVNWLLLQSGPCLAAFNMALDEALLEAMPRVGKPVLRFYGWSEPAASFGYFQRFAEVERATQLRPLVRRPTGGGIVSHDADWTYSIAIPPGHEWHSLKAGESYRRVHEWMQAAFGKLAVATELAMHCKESPETICRSRREDAHSEKSESSQGLPALSPAGQCFAGYGRFDLLWQGRKIAGAAQRRNMLGLLIQGSVQLSPISIARAEWQQAVRDAGRVGFEIKWQEFEPDKTLLKEAGRLAAQKYSQPAYNRKR